MKDRCILLHVSEEQRRRRLY